MLEIILKLPRQVNEHIYYDGTADKYLNLPIVVDEQPIGLVIEILNDTNEYVEVRGILFKAGTDLLKKENNYIPCDITILR